MNESHTNLDKQFIKTENDAGQANPTRISRASRRLKSKAGWVVGSILVLLFGLIGGYGLIGIKQTDNKTAVIDSAMISSLVKDIYPENGYSLPITLGQTGPQMVAAGIIDRTEFIATYEKAGQPLSSENLAMLDGTYADAVLMSRVNAYFLLNFFWALGLSNKNPILETGPIQQNSNGSIEGFASTGGWTLSTKPIRDIFSSQKILVLNQEQQLKVEETSKAVYRPCCNNPTHFPDCNHGMAMLGLLELMASQNVSLEDMLVTAKYANAYWYPQQTLEQAIYFKLAEGKSYKDIDARLLLGQQYSSSSGFASLHQLLGENGWLPNAQNGGGSCGV